MYEPKVIRITVLILLVAGSLVDAKSLSKHGRRGSYYAEKPLWRRDQAPSITASTSAGDPVISTEAASAAANTAGTATTTFASKAVSTKSTRQPYPTTRTQKQSTVPVTLPAERAAIEWPTTFGPTKDFASTLPTTTTKTAANYSMAATPIGPRTPDASTPAGEKTEDSAKTTWTEASSTDPTDNFFDAETTKVATPARPLVFTTAEGETTRVTGHAGVKNKLMDRTTGSTSDVLETTTAVNELSTTTETPSSYDVHSVGQFNNDTAMDDLKNTTDPGPTITTETPKSIDRFREAMSAALEMIFDDGEKTTDSNVPLMTTQLPVVGTEDINTTPSPSIETVTIIDFSTHPPTDETTAAVATGIRELVTPPSTDEVPPESAELLEQKLEMIMHRLKGASDAMDEFYRQIGQQVNTLDEKVNQYIARPKTWKNCIQRPVDARKWLTSDMLELFCENGQFMKRIELRRGPLGNLSVECCTME